MNLKKELERRFAMVLEPEAYVKGPGRWVSFIKREPTIHYHVDAENHSYSNEFTVTLQTVDVNGKRMRARLQDLANVRGRYAYPGESTELEDRSDKILDREGTLKVVEQACEHLRVFGVPWLRKIKCE